MNTTIEKSAVRVDFSGRGKKERTTAFMQIAALSFLDSTSRVALVNALRVALGSAPTEAQIIAARNEYVIGRVACRLQVTQFQRDAFPGNKVTDDGRLTAAREMVLFYAAPTKPGSQERKLRAHQTGRRSAIQHKACRAAEEAWSQVKAELGIGNAQTQQQRDAKKRAPAAAGSTKRGKADAATLTQLATPAKPLTADDAINHIMTQSASLQDYANKHAKLLPLGFGEAVIAFRQACNKAGNEHATAKAAADANK